MKNFTNNLKQFTSRLSARWLIMSLMLLLGISSAWGWGFKYDDGGNWNTCSSSNFDNTTFYTDPTGSSTTSVYIKMHTGLVKTGFNITQKDGCDGQKLYVNLSGVASTSSNTIVRASARWVNNKGIYSEYTIVIPDGKIYIKPTNGDAVLMTKSTYTYTAELTLSDAKTFDLYADDPGNSKIENQDGMPSAGKPTSVRLNYTGLTSPYQYVKVTYNLKTNQITFEEKTPPCDPPSAPRLTNPDAQCGESITLPATYNEFTLKWYDENSSVVNNTTITSSGTYYAAAVGECESIERTPYIITINPVPSAPSFTTGGETTCAEKPVNPALSNALGDGKYLVWYDASEGGTNLGSNLTSSAEDGTTIYYAAVSNGACESADRTQYKVDVEADPIVDLTLTLVDGYGNSLPLNYTYCQGDDVNVKLTYNGGIYWGEPEWNSTLTAGDMNTSGLRYDAVNKKGEGTYTISNLQASGTLQVALTMCGDTKATSNVLNVNITPQAETPTVEVLLNIEKCGNDITQYGKIQISPYNAGYTYKINDTDVTPNNNGIVENLSTAGRFTLSAINSCKVSTPSAPFTISETDNKPTISISGSEKAVLYEDVMLTAIATQGATVKWYEGGVNKGEGLTYVVTSETATSKTITAKAFLNGCESTEASHPVTFSAEDCSKSEVTTESTKIEIWCRETGSSQAGSNLTCYAWYNDGSNHDLNSDNTNKGTKTSVTKTSNIEGQEYTYRVWEFDMQNYGDYDVYVIFKKSTTAWDWQTSDLTAGKRNNRYFFIYDGSQNEQSKRGKKYSKSESLSVTTKTITAPAVKTVSATSEEGSGIVTFTGKLLKTGCATGSAIWVGYQYKKANEEWPTTGVTAGSGEKQLVSIDNNPGLEDFTVNVEGLEDVDYHFRAYVINGYGRSADANNYDQGVYYGLDKLVTVSTVQTAVTTATIQLVDADGKEVDKNKKYCVGETGYIKVTSDVKYTTIKWKTDKGTEIEETGNDGVYPFVAKGDDNIWVMLSNKHNKPESPAINENPLVINTFADPILPRVSLNKVSICSNDEVGATVKLTNVVKGQTYQLYQQIENAGGSFTEQAIGEAKTQTEEVTDKTELVLHTLNNTYTTGKYFVKTYTSDCEENKVATQPFTFTVVDAAEVFISIDPTSAETTPWMPAKFTVSASDAYTLNVTKGIPAEPATEVEVNQNGNKVSVKIPLPEGATGGEGQYENVVFPGGATTQYTITATLSAAGGDNPCAAPTSATINLVPYVEECTKGH